MEGFTYSDIFETKGIEYLVIIFFLLVLIPFWLFVNKPGYLKSKVAIIQNLTTKILRIPQGIFFSKNHTWSNLEKSGKAWIGIDDFLYRVVGDIKISLVKQPGEFIKKGETMALISGNGKQIKVLSPLAGEIVDCNSNLLFDNGLLNADLYGKGWFYYIKPENWKTDTTDCYLAAETSEWMANEIARLKDFFGKTLTKYNTELSPVMLQEGGELVMNPLEEMDQEIWSEFEKEFLA